MRIEADRDTCVGSGSCVLAAPALFDQDDDEAKVVLLDPAPSPDQQDAARDAVAMCPSGALRLVEG